MFLSSCHGDLGVPLKLQQGSQASSQVELGNSAFLSSFYRVVGRLLELQGVTQGSSRVAAEMSGLLWICSGKLGLPLKATGISGFLLSCNRGVGPPLKLRQASWGSSRVV